MGGLHSVYTQVPTPQRSHPQMGPSPSTPAQRAAPGSLQGRRAFPGDNSQRPSIEASEGIPAALAKGSSAQVMQTRRNLAPQRAASSTNVRQLGETPSNCAASAR